MYCGIMNTSRLANSNYLSVSVNDVLSVVTNDEISPSNNGFVTKGFGHPAEIILANDGSSVGGSSQPIKLNFESIDTRPATLVVWSTQKNNYFQIVWWRNGNKMLPIISDPVFIDAGDASWVPYPTTYGSNYVVMVSFRTTGFIMRTYMVNYSGGNNGILSVTSGVGSPYNFETDDSAFTIVADKFGTNIPDSPHYAFITYDVVNKRFEYMSVQVGNTTNGAVYRNGGFKSTNFIAVDEFTKISSLIGLSPLAGSDGYHCNTHLVMVVGMNTDIVGNPRKVIAISGAGGIGTTISHGTYPSVLKGGFVTNTGLYMNSAGDVSGGATRISAKRLGETSVWFYHSGGGVDIGETRFGIVNIVPLISSYQSTSLSDSTVIGYTNLPLYLKDSRANNSMISQRNGSFPSNIESRRCDTIGGTRFLNATTFGTNQSADHVVIARTMNDGDYVRLYFGTMQYNVTFSSQQTTISGLVTGVNGVSRPESGFNAVEPLNVFDGNEQTFTLSTCEPVFLDRTFSYCYSSKNYGGFQVPSVIGVGMVPSSPPAPMALFKPVFQVLRGEEPVGLSRTTTSVPKGIVNFTYFGDHVYANHGMVVNSELVAHGNGTMNSSNMRKYANVVGVYDLNVSVPKTLVAVRENYTPQKIGCVKDVATLFVR